MELIQWLTGWLTTSDSRHKVTLVITTRLDYRYEHALLLANARNIVITAGDSGVITTTILPFFSFHFYWFSFVSFVELMGRCEKSIGQCLVNFFFSFFFSFVISANCGFVSGFVEYFPLIRRFVNEMMTFVSFSSSLIWLDFFFRPVSVN